MVAGLLQIVGIIGMATLLFICITLSLTRNTRVFVAVGQDVFRWLAVLLCDLIALRTLTGWHLVSTEFARTINSIVFLVVVGGIVWNVSRHGRAAQ